MEQYTKSAMNWIIRQDQWVHYRRIQGSTTNGIYYNKECYKRTYSTIGRNIRDATWMKYHQNKIKGQCYCCGTTLINYKHGWHCSHVIARSKGGITAVENLRTCCKYCNIDMGNCNLYVYILRYNLTGPGTKHIKTHFQQYPSQINDKRTH